jgi:hypothetical protein
MTSTWRGCGIRFSPKAPSGRPWLTALGRARELLLDMRSSDALAGRILSLECGHVSTLG